MTAVRKNEGPWVTVAYKTQRGLPHWSTSANRLLDPSPAAISPAARRAGG